jgi:hypothetical protein
VNDDTLSGLIAARMAVEQVVDVPEPRYVVDRLDGRPIRGHGPFPSFGKPHLVEGQSDLLEDENLFLVAEFHDRNDAKLSRHVVPVRHKPGRFSASIPGDRGRRLRLSLSASLTPPIGGEL